MNANPVAVTSGESPSLFKDSFESPTPPPPDPRLPPFAVRLFNKCAYGPRPDDVASFNALASNDVSRLNLWLDRQLNPASINDSACNTRIANGNFRTYSRTLPELWAIHVRGAENTGNPRNAPVDEATCIKLIRAVYSECQLYEVMVDFWHNHFNVQGWEYSIAPIFMHYDRDVMRGVHPTNGKRYALGNFRALLEEVAKAPAMLMYLDNKSSRGAGFNENYARELCELHTLGAENYYGTATAGSIPRYGNDTSTPGLPKGYSDFYVYEAARCLTGWTMRDKHWEFPDTAEYDTGEFLYYTPWHDRASKNFLASDFSDLVEPDGPAMSDGRYVFDKLASHPGTATYICRKLCRRFISDTPPQELVDSAAAIWRDQWQAPDQIAQVLRHILTSDAFMNTWAEKTKRPWETIMHAFRATSTDFTPQPRGDTWNSYTDLMDRIQQTGNGPFRWPTPDGYPDTSSKWSAVSPLAQTWRLLSRLTELYTPGASESDASAYFLRIESITRSSFPGPNVLTSSVIDFWIQRIYGYEIAPSRRNQIMCFLAQKSTPAEAAQTALTWDNAWNGSNLSRHYTLPRLRAAIALLMMCPEFYHR